MHRPDGDKVTRALKAYVRSPQVLDLPTAVLALEGLIKYGGVLDMATSGDNDEDEHVKGQLRLLMPPEVTPLFQDIHGHRHVLLQGISSGVCSVNPEGPFSHIYNTLSQLPDLDMMLLVAHCLARGGLPITIRAIPQVAMYHIIQALTRPDQCAVLDLAGTRPKDIERLGSMAGIGESNRCSIQQLKVKNGLWLSEKVQSRADKAWEKTIVGFWRVVASFASLTSLTIEDCNVDILKAHEIDFNRVQITRHPFQHLTSLAFRFTDPLSHRYGGWDILKGILRGMLPMPQLKKLELPEPGSVRDGNQFKKFLLQLPRLEDVSLKLPRTRTWRRRSDALHPYDANPDVNEALEYGIPVQLVTTLRSVNLHVMEPDIFAGWSLILEKLTKASLGIVPSSIEEYRTPFKFMTRLTRLELNLTTDGTTYPQETCNWCRARPYVFTYIRNMKRLQVLKMLMQCKAQCCKWDFGQLDRQICEQLQELDIRATATSAHQDIADNIVWGCATNNELMIPSLPLCRRLTLHVPTAPTEASLRNLQCLQSAHTVSLRMILVGHSHVDGGSTPPPATQFIGEYLRRAQCIRQGHLRNLEIGNIQQVTHRHDNTTVPDPEVSRLGRILQVAGLRHMSVPTRGMEESVKVLDLIRGCECLDSLHQIMLDDTDMVPDFEVPDQLRRLSLQIARVPAAAPAILSRLTRLRYLRIQFVARYKPLHLQRVTASLGGLHQLERLVWIGGSYERGSIDANGSLLVQGFMAAFKELSEYNHLHTLELYRAPFCTAPPGMPQTLCGLKSLRNFKVTGGMAGEVMRAWGRELQRNPMNITSLFIGDIRDEDVGYGNLWGVIKGLPYLLQFDFTFIPTLEKHDNSFFMQKVARGPNASGKRYSHGRKLNPNDVHNWMLTTIKAALGERGVHPYKVGGGRGKNVAQYLEGVSGPGVIPTGMDELFQSNLDSPEFSLQRFKEEWDSPSL